MTFRAWMAWSLLKGALCAAVGCSHVSSPDLERGDGSSAGNRDASSEARGAAPHFRPYSLEQLLASAVQPASGPWGVRFSLMDAQGRADAEARTARLGTPGSPFPAKAAPRLTLSPVAQASVPLVPCVLAVFDRPVDRELLQREARFEVAGHVVPALAVPWATATRLEPCGPSAERLLAGAGTELGLAFVPERMLPPNSEVVFHSGRVQGLGDEHSAPGITDSMRTYGPFAVLPAATSEATSFGMNVRVRLSNPLRGTLLPERMAITPSAQIAAADVFGSELQLVVLGDPNRSYTLTLPDDLEDVSGQRLSAEARTATIPAIAKAVAPLLQGPRGVVVLPARQPLIIESFGVQALAVRVRSVGIEDAARFFRPDGSQPDAASLLKDAKSHEVAVAEPWNYTRTSLALEPFGAASPGHYLVEVSGRSDKGTPKNLSFWVQRTSLHLVARNRAKHVFARLTDAASEAPVRGARIGLSDGASAATDADGWVKLPRPAAPAKLARLLVARSGAESVFLRAEHYTREVGLSRASSQTLPKLVVYSDRETYFPGEKVVFHAYARRFTDDAPGLSNAQLPKSLPLVLQTDYDGPILAKADAALGAHGEFALTFKLPADTPPGHASLKLRGAPSFEFPHSIRILPLPTRGFETSLMLSQRRVGRGESVTAVLEAQDAAGEPVAKLPVNLSVEVRSMPFSVPGFEAFMAGGYDGAAPMAVAPSAEDQLRHRAQGETDASGRVTLKLVAERLEHPIRYLASVRSFASDGQGRHFEQRKQFIVDAADQYAGLRSDGAVRTHKAWSVDLLGVDKTGKVVAGIPIEVRVTALEKPERELARCKLVSTLAPMPCTFPPLVHEGAYAVTAEVVDALGRRSMSRQVVRAATSLPSYDAKVPVSLAGHDAWEQASELVQGELTLTLEPESTAEGRVRVVAQVTDASGKPVPGARLAWMSVDEEAIDIARVEPTPLTGAFQGPYYSETLEETFSYTAPPPPDWRRRPLLHCGTHDREEGPYLRKRARPLLDSGFAKLSDAKGRVSFSFPLPGDAGALVSVLATRGAAEFGRATLRVPGDGPSCKGLLAFCP